MYSLVINNSDIFCLGWLLDSDLNRKEYLQNFNFVSFDCIAVAESSKVGLVNRCTHTTYITEVLQLAIIVESNVLRHSCSRIVVIMNCHSVESSIIE